MKTIYRTDIYKNSPQPVLNRKVPGQTVMKVMEND